MKKLIGRRTSASSDKSFHLDREALGRPGWPPIRLRRIARREGKAPFSALSELGASFL